MIEVTIWFGGIDGDGAHSYLIDTPHPELFDTKPHKYAINRALEEFCSAYPKMTIGRVNVHVAPQTVIT